MQPVEEIEQLQSIRIVPVGSLARAEGERLTALVSRYVALPCHFDETRLADALRFLPGREQADADYLLRRLEQHVVGAGTVVVGIADIDLGLPILTHVFGGARDGGHTAVVSLARLKQEFYGLPADEELTGRRAVAEVLHEVGHLAGLAHCDRYDCVMHFSPDVEAIDLRRLSYCAACALELPAGLLPG
jgi:archaemetzincin